MRKFLVFLAFATVAIAWFAFSPGKPSPTEPPQVGRNKWIYTKKVLKVKNLEFREGLETSFIFQFDPADSLKIRCNSCLPNIINGNLSITFQGGEGQTMKIGRKRLDIWHPVASVTGKFGLIFYGNKNVDVRDLEIVRKSDSSKVRPGPDIVPLDVKNLFVNGAAGDPDEEKLQFFFDLARKDEVIIQAKTVSSTIENLVCDWYKEGEEFDSDIAPMNIPFFIPSDATFYGNYIFEFGVKDQGKENVFNLRLERTPAPIEEIVVEDPNANKDTISEETAMLMELIKALTPEETKEFECAGMATALSSRVPARLNISPGNRNRQCFEIPLSEECADPTETCPKCSFWVFWMGVGEESHNQYRFRDSTRKLITGKGIIESYANAIKFMGVSGTGIFPTVKEGEDIFFAIVNDANRDKFLQAKELPPLPGRDPEINAVASGLWVTGYQVLKYNPGEKLNLCLCNNNELSPVPVLFNFQQFLALSDTAKAS